MREVTERDSGYYIRAAKQHMQGRYLQEFVEWVNSWTPSARNMSSYKLLTQRRRRFHEGGRSRHVSHIMVSRWAGRPDCSERREFDRSGANSLAEGRTRLKCGKVTTEKDTRASDRPFDRTPTGAARSTQRCTCVHMRSHSRSRGAQRAPQS